MTIDQTREPDDAELDAFLRGEGDISPRLKRLSQPSPPPEVSAAVLADIEAALLAEKDAPAAANDSVSNGDAASRPQRLSSRWRMPAAFAASVLLGVMIHHQWRESRNQAGMEAAQSSPRVALQSASVEKPSVQEAAAAGNQPLALPTPHLQKAETQAAQSAPAANARTQAPAPRTPVIVAQAPVPAARVQTVVTTGIRASLQQSLNVKRKADTVVEVVAAEDVGKMPDKNVADTLQRLPGISVNQESKESATPLEQKRRAVNDIDVFVNDNGASAYGGMPEKHANAAALPPPAPVAAAPSIPTKEETGAAKAWLDKIEKKIELGEAHDALEEWEKFRKAYPDFIVPDKLAEKIKALQQK